MFEIYPSLSLAADAIASLCSSYNYCGILCDEQMHHLYAKQIAKAVKNVHFIIIPSGEQAKDYSSLMKCWQQMTTIGMDRHSVLIAIGGGSTSDLGGFAASTYMRGIDFIVFPTTYMSMVDAAFGGKNGINFSAGKNRVGTYYLPKHVVICLETLQSLPDREYFSGMAEVIKYAIIKDPNLFNLLETEHEKIKRREGQLLEAMIKRSIQIKMETIANDIRNESRRDILNFGHTFAHAIESATNYSAYLHGEAVAMGMCAAARVSHHLDLIDMSLVERIENLCSTFHLPIRIPTISQDRLIDLMKKDKKSHSGEIALILMKTLGNVFKQTNVDPKIIKQCLGFPA